MDLNSLCELRSILAALEEPILAMWWKLLLARAHN